MPTNGVVEWVFQVLDSIFCQGIHEELYEVVITDNGNCQEFKEKMRGYEEKYSNLVYAETTALPFLNEIEAYKRANGILIKFVNHRTLLVEGALQKLIDFAEDYEREKPIVYFSNGVLKLGKTQHVYDSFDLFVKNLSYYSSWSTGMAIWKDDFDRLPEQIADFNELFPHTTVLFGERDRETYIIDNTLIMEEIPVGTISKGNYDLFHAFGIEYPGILADLLRDGSITAETYRFVAGENLDFVVSLYWSYCVRKRPCSYDLRGLENIFGVFYKKQDFVRKYLKYGVRRAAGKLGLMER